MDLAVNKEGQSGCRRLAHAETANTGTLVSPMPKATSQPMHAAGARDLGMARALLRVTSRVDRTAIAQTILAGLDPVVPRRAEDALNGFWPASAPPRCLGAIVSHLARAGLIVEAGWTKGRTGRSHAGRVSLWLRATP